MFLCIMVVKVLLVCLFGGWFGVFLIVGCDFFQVEDELKKNPNQQIKLLSYNNAGSSFSHTDLDGMEDEFGRRTVLEKSALVFQTL